MNLLTSHFVIGCSEIEREFTQTETGEIRILHNWLDFKDNDWAMEWYRSSRTQYITFPHFYPIDVLEEIIRQQYKSYRKVRPYCKTGDFLKEVWGYTKFDLKWFLDNKSKIHILSEIPNESTHRVFTIFTESEYIDIIIVSRQHKVDR